jgi:3-dehydroquinate dehydratase type I
VKPRICVPIPINKISDTVSLIEKAENSSADLIEIRFDYLSMDISNIVNWLEKIVKQSTIPLIATNRQYDQGGFYIQNEEKRIKILIKAAEKGFRYVDIELTTGRLKQIIKKVKELGAKPIISFHNFKGTPTNPELKKILRSQIESGAEVCKIVTTANDLSDSIRCLLLTKKMSKITDMVFFAMGEKGVLSRVLSPVFGAFFTFASLESNLETAPGQMSIVDMIKLYRKLGVYE